MYNFIFTLMIHKSFINHNSSNAQLQISKAHFLSLGKHNGPYDQAAVIMIQFTHSTQTLAINFNCSSILKICVVQNRKVQNKNIVLKCPVELTDLRNQLCECKLAGFEVQNNSYSWPDAYFTHELFTIFSQVTGAHRSHVKQAKACDGRLGLCLLYIRSC